MENISVLSAVAPVPHFSEGLLFQKDRELRENVQVCDPVTCVIFENDRYRCKYCRLQKCYDVGMDSAKFQTNRDLISNSNIYKKKLKVSLPQSLSNFLGRPEFILCCEPDKVSNVKTVIDVSDLVFKATRILREDDLLYPFKFDNSLERLTFVMENMKTRKGNKKLQLLKNIGKPESLMFFEKNFISAAQWFAGFPEFTELDMNVQLSRIDILKSSWLLWLRLGKLSETVEYQKKKMLGTEVLMCSEGACVNIDKVNIDLSWCTNYSVEQLRSFMMSGFDEYWKKSIDSLIQLEPTNVELNFMLIQLCLNEAGKKFQGKILEATDKLILIQANNLHDYYTKKLKMSNYSSRLAKMMKVNKGMEADVRERKEMSRIARVFDMFSIEYSHPEMFETAHIS
ncbi:hypothetical protein CRE_08757 [Caenorhabditis remanei]|uniref:NR LBD domain-containing protein n=1 Tax=Caenorhabditis remanei TaxID=31234 RepID=E3LHC9_CAERE|nr:hypothetical protein CRE_08757 [Caenorhabditis remanei]